MNVFTCDLSWSCAAELAAFQLFMNSIRYFPLAGGLFLVAWVWQKSATHRFRIQEKYPEAAKIWFELRRSFSTLIVFALVGSASMMGSKVGISQLYLDISEYGVPYMFLNLALLTLWHETFFYWAHRFMHRKPWFKWIHLTHHRSTNPSPMAAYSFSVPEAFLEAVYLAVFLVVVPTHPIVVLSHLLYAMLMNIWWHSGFELMPSGWTRGPITKWINTSTHHNMHHSHFNGNYSLYFNFWDRICGTNFPAYDEYFETVVARRDQYAASAERAATRSLSLNA